MAELLGLTWADVDFRAEKIHVRAQLSRPKRDQPGRRVPVKTDTERSVDLDPETISFLRSHRERALGFGLARDTNYVFCTLPDGRPVHYRNLGKAFVKAATRAGLNSTGARQLRFHDLRRTFASILLNGDCSITYAANQLGHTPAVLLSTYAGIIDRAEQADKGRAALAAARNA